MVDDELKVGGSGGNAPGMSNETILQRAVNAAYFKAVADVFDRMVRDLDSGKPLQATRLDMNERLDRVRTVYGEMQQRAADLDP